MNQHVHLQNRLNRLENLVEKQKQQLHGLQSKRLLWGLGIFILLVLSQILKGFLLEFVALLFFFPIFLFYFKKSKKHSEFIQSISELIDFYQHQNEFRKGVFQDSTPPENMAAPDLARDLDLGTLFHSLNHCCSQQGQDKLNQWLCQVFADSKRQQRQSGIQSLAKLSGPLRRLHMRKLERKIDFSRIENGVQRSFFESPMPWMWLIPLSWICFIVVVVLGGPSLIWKTTLLIYVGSMLSFIGKTQHLFSRLQDIHHDFSSLSEKISLYEKLASRLPQYESLVQHQASGDIKKLNRLISLMSMKTNPIIFYILNLIAPWDFLLAHLSEKSRKNFYLHFQHWSVEMIELEALSSLANLAIYHQTHWAEECDHFIQAEDMAHPLIDQSKIVKNSFHPKEDRVIIITGSNMSGKSTFLRALGINFCLANIGAPVFAKTFLFRPMQLLSCIRVSDSLRDGQSYFYAEVQRMKVILQTAKNQPILFLIDEPLRGTNNRERLIGNQSYLRQILQTQACGFLCTHDLELTQLADGSPEIANFHFSEQWDSQDLHFDYKIKQGPSQSTNALKILAREGLYPEA